MMHAAAGQGLIVVDVMRNTCRAGEARGLGIDREDARPIFFREQYTRRAFARPS